MYDSDQIPEDSRRSVPGDRFFHSMIDPAQERNWKESMRKSKTLQKALAAALTMLLAAGTWLPASAEGSAGTPDPSPSSEVTEETAWASSSSSETPAAGISSAEPAGVSETPSAGKMNETGEASGTASEEETGQAQNSPEPSSSVSPDAENSAGNSGSTPASSPEASSSASAEETSAPTASADTEPVTPEETPAETENTSGLSLVVPQDDEAYAAAVAELDDDPSLRLTVTTGQDLSSVLNFGKGVYYSGTYLFVFDSTEEREKAEAAIQAALGSDGRVLEDEVMEICGYGSSPSISHSSEVTGLSTAALSDSDDDPVLVALIDTGVRADLADMSVNFTSDPDEDANGHGTAMAEIIHGTAGEKARILSIKAFGDDGRGSLASVTAAVRFAKNAGADIISLSASIKDSKRTEAFKEAVTSACADGIIVVAAAGNAGADASEYAPGNLECVDTVGAAYPLSNTNAAAAAPFSNWGDAVDYWYLASSTSEAAATEAAILAAGLEDTGWEDSGNWYRYRTVRYADGSQHSEEDTALYDSGDYEQFLTAKRVNPPGSGNIGVNRVGPYDPVSGTYPNSTFYYKPTGETVRCLDPSLTADYDATYVPDYSTSVSYRSETWTYPDSRYSGTVTQHTVTLNPSSTDPYTPGETYTYANTDSSTDLSKDGYYIRSITVSTGDQSAVSSWIEGNSVKVKIRADAEEMPDGISIEIQTDRTVIGSCRVSFRTTTKTASRLSAGAGNQPFSLPGSLSGGDSTEEETGRDCSATHLYSGAKLTMQVIRGGVDLLKQDADRIRTSHPGNAQGSATLAGTEYTIINTRNQQPVARFTTDETGKPAKLTWRAEGTGTALDGNLLKWGDYLITETKAPEGYFLNPDWSFYFEVREDQRIYHASSDGSGTNGGTVLQQVIRGGIEVTKYDTERYVSPTEEARNTPQGDASLAGAEFEVINVSEKEVLVNGVWYAPGSTVMTLVTDEAGHAATSSDALPYGKYRIHETKAPEGYVLNAGWDVTIAVTESGRIYDAVNLSGAGYVLKKTEAEGETGHDYVYDHAENGMITSDFLLDDVVRGGVKFQKRDREADSEVPQGDGTMEGAVITVYNASDHSVMVHGSWVKPGEAALNLVTDADGFCSSENDALPYGSYYAIETQAPVGYLINRAWRTEFEIREDGVILDETETLLKDQVIRGDVRVYKYDQELNASEAIGGSMHEAKTANLNGIAFDVTNVSLHSVFVRDDDDTLKEIPAGSVVTRIYTSYNDALGAYTAETSDGYLPYGTYTIQEVPVSESGTEMIKMSEQEKKTSANDAYLLTDGTPRTFQIGEHSYGPVTLDTQTEEVNGLITDFGSAGVPKDGIEFNTALSDRARSLLTYVTYDPTDGHAVTNTVSFVKQDGTSSDTVANPMSDLSERNGTLIHKSGNTYLDETMVFKNAIKRNDFLFKKNNAYTSSGIETLWVLKNQTTGERHVLYTSVNGEFSSTAEPHSRNTNANDRYLELIDAGKTISLSPKAENEGKGEVTTDAGIWFGLGEDGSEAAVNDDLAALPYGNYTLSEVSTDTNEGKTLQHVEFRITKDSSIAEPVNLGTITNYGIELRSKALNTATGTRLAKADGSNITITDTVWYDGVIETDQDYVLVGKLYNSASGEFLKDASGNEITSVREVHITSGSGKIEGQTFEVNTADLSGVKLVVYEYLYPKESYEG